MANIFLQDIIEDISLSTLPYNWTFFDLKSFSRKKVLWDFQQRALENAIKVLWKYYEDLVDFQNGESIEVNLERKKRLFRWYKDNGLEDDLDIKLDKRSRKINNLLLEYYSPEDGKIPYYNYINRISFWMATGSGKTIVIIKLILLLIQLMERREIPQYDILFLTHRDDLIEQFKKTIDEVNYANPFKIELRELKEYPEVKKQGSLFGITVFYYRSDNLSDEQKEKIVDFKNYDNDGKWYIFLDEAHKGDKEDSKRQHIYSILSRNGFLFNFSATFTDERDIKLTAFEFNLSSFINAGYGKHISILNQQFRAFREDEDYTEEEKQKIVLKSLILLTYIKKCYEKIGRIEKGLYHNPLLLTLVNSINKENADLKLFFREIEKIGKGDIRGGIFESALQELWTELKDGPELVFEDEKALKFDETVFLSITLKDIWKYVYNSSSPGEIEISFRPSDKKQVAFKLTTSDKHFALSKTGDIPTWLKEELERFNVNHQFEEEGFFERINQEDSPINILMGSRAFYEGWDSNRPNVINFINIGTGTDAKKFILQSVGRGVRIEPLTNKRRRLLELYNNKEIQEDLFRKLKDKVLPVETLFVFGTNRAALLTVIKELKQQKKEKGKTLSLFVNDAVEGHKLLIPLYQTSSTSFMKKRNLAKFPISSNDLELLQRYVDYLSDARVFLMRYNATPERVKFLKESFRESWQYYKETDEKSFRNPDLLVQRVLDYFSIVPEELKEFKSLEDEIRHFKNIRVKFEDLSTLKNKIEKVSRYRTYRERRHELEKLFREGKITFEELEREIKGSSPSEEFQWDHKKIRIKYVANHYYVPLILTDEEKIDYITHIIKTPSEVKFINDLEEYLKKEENKFQNFEWWFFSKLDESMDEVYIPYYNPDMNKVSKFYPDFIFWLKKRDNYFIIFVDPKGTKHTDYMHKVDGYNMIFTEHGRVKEFSYQGFKIKVYLFLHTDDIHRLGDSEYRNYWFDNMDRMLNAIS